MIFYRHANGYGMVSVTRRTGKLKTYADYLEVNAHLRDYLKNDTIVIQGIQRIKGIK